MIRTYSELVKLDTFEKRFKYLKLDGIVGSDTFGYDRYLNQNFYRSKEWRSIRDRIIVRDNGCDLGIPDRRIGGRILIHHLNPIATDDIVDYTEYLTNPEYLICVSHDTHNAIHYGDESLLIPDYMERKPNDMCPWRK